MISRIATCLFVALIGSVFLLGERASAAVIEVGDLNIIDDPGNPSDGLRFLDMTFSSGKTLADAIASAITSYANVRVATPSEFGDLLAAAGLVYDGSETASDAFTVGSDAVLISNMSDEVISLQEKLGSTFVISGAGFFPDYFYTYIFSDPDGDDTISTTRDVLYLQHASTVVGGITSDGRIGILQSNFTPSQNSPGFFAHGWLLVSDAATVPEPSSALLMCLGTAGWLGCQRRRKRERPTVA